jgi:hypothetical protein
MKTKGSRPRVEGLVKSLLAPEELVLKVGAEVMFVANDFAAGFVNGSRGRVIRFDDDLPLVKLYTGKIIKVEPYTWSIVEDGKVRAEAVQLPLRLAWAITIHKSQGMSLDAAQIDLSKSFTPGMGYVALSRVRSLNGIYLTGINAMALQLHPDIYEFDREALRASAELAGQVEDAEEEARQPKPETLHDEELFQKLRQWRLEQARSLSVAPFMVAHDTTLIELATRKPRSIQQLQGIKGFGPKKAETYGKGILEAIAGHTGREVQAAAAWSRAENELLKEAVKEGDSIEQVAQKLGRTPNEVWAQIRKLL